MSATLTSLRIQNLALVEDLTWDPQTGFTAITGETGAGKSIILGALGLLLGDRADRGLIRSGSKNCSVEAVFENVRDPRIAGALAEAGAEACEEERLLLKRTIQAEGAGRQFANGSACTLALLRSMGDLLVDLHGPHDHQSLFSRDQQTRLLDAFASCQTEWQNYCEARKSLLALRREAESLLGDRGSLHREIDLLEYQANEIEAAGLSLEEEEALLARHQAASHAARILEACAALESLVGAEENSLSSLAAELVRTTREVSRLDPSAAELAASSESVAETVNECADVLRRYTQAFESDPASLTAMENRLDAIGTLKRKYGSTLTEVLDFGQQARTRLEDIRGRLERADSIDANLSAAMEAVVKAGKLLSAKRGRAAEALQKSVSCALADLGFARSEFLVRLEPAAEPGPLGLELAEFVFAPNPGEEARPLRSIASSGEISRIMLALKGALAEQDDVPLLVFDEIDANVGGEIAGKVAARMRTLSEGRQVLCITHLPQVAASAHHHFVVKKSVSHGRTHTLLEACSGETRVREIARMLGGHSPTALAHAKDLLHCVGS